MGKLSNYDGNLTMCQGEEEGGVMCHGLASYLGKIVIFLVSFCDRNQGQASSFMNLLTSKSLISLHAFFFACASSHAGKAFFYPTAFLIYMAHCFY